MAAETPKVFLLPSQSADARIVSLSHPATSQPCRFYHSPDQGIYEFTKVAAPKASPRSWLLARPREATRAEEAVDGSADLGKGYVSRQADLYVATPIDPLFLVLPVLASTASGKEADHQVRFLAADDYLEQLSEQSEHFLHVLDHDRTRRLFEQRLAAVCDKVEAGDEDMFRLSEEKVLSELLRKAKGMARSGLPASMEDRFVRRALEVPVVGVMRDGEVDAGEETTKAPSLSVSTSTASEESSASAGSAASASTTVTTPEVDSATAATDDLTSLLRVRTALDYICGSYLPPGLSASLTKLLGSSSEIDFKPLDEHLAHLDSLRRQALASRSLADYSRKRSIEDEEAREGRAEKKRKKEEEEKRKRAGESRGVRDLKKADISGMKKMSAFFGVKSRS